MHGWERIIRHPRTYSGTREAMGAKRTIYMDHSATTFVKPEVVTAMIPYFTEHFGNPSSIYSIARESKKAIDAARVQTAKALGADPSAFAVCTRAASIAFFDSRAML